MKTNQHAWDKIRRRWLILGALTLLVIVLAALAFWPAQEEKTSPPLVAGYTPDQVSRIEVRAPRKSPRMRFEREAQAWRMVSPYSLPASRANLERLLELPLTQSRRRYRVGEVDLAELGLDPPEAIVRLDDLEIRFGRQHPLKLQRYVQVGDQVHLIDDALFFLLSSPPTFWLDHRLIPEGKIQGLKLPKLSLHRTERGGWKSTPEQPDETLRALVEAWQYAHAVEISPWSEAPPPAGPPEIVVETDRGKIRFRLLAKEPEVLLLREDVRLEYHLLPETAETLGLIDARASRSGDHPPRTREEGRGQEDRPS